MDDPIKTILRFLDHCEAIEGRAGGEITAEWRDKIRRFVEGGCSSEERSGIISELARNRALEHLLAKEVQRRRDNGGND